jgi:hypothetical protein
VKKKKEKKKNKKKKKKKKKKKTLTANICMCAKVPSTNMANRNNCRETLCSHKRQIKFTANFITKSMKL